MAVTFLTNEDKTELENKIEEVRKENTESGGQGSQGPQGPQGPQGIGIKSVTIMEVV